MYLYYFVFLIAPRRKMSSQKYTYLVLDRCSCRKMFNVVWSVERKL